MGTFIVGMALLAIVAFIIGGMVRTKKQGKSIHCGEGCSSCGGSCHRN